MIVENQIAAGRTGSSTVARTESEARDPGFAGIFDGAMAKGFDGESGVVGGASLPDGSLPADGLDVGVSPTGALAPGGDLFAGPRIAAGIATGKGGSGAAGHRRETGADPGGMTDMAGLVLSQVAATSAGTRSQDDTAVPPGVDRGAVGNPGAGQVYAQADGGLAMRDTQTAGAGNALRDAAGVAGVPGDESVLGDASETGSRLGPAAPGRPSPPAVTTDAGPDAGVSARDEPLARDQGFSGPGAAPTIQPVARPVPAAETLRARAKSQPGPAKDGRTSITPSGTAGRAPSQGARAVDSAGPSRIPRPGSDGGEPAVPITFPEAITVPGLAAAGLSDGGADKPDNGEFAAPGRTSDRVKPGNRHATGTPIRIGSGYKVDTGVPQREMARSDQPVPRLAPPDHSTVPDPDGPGNGTQAMAHSTANVGPAAAHGSGLQTGLDKGPMAVGLGGALLAATPAAGEGPSRRSVDADVNFPNTPSDRTPVGWPADPNGTRPNPSGAAGPRRARDETTQPSPMLAAVQDMPGGGGQALNRAAETARAAGQGAARLQYVDLFQPAGDARDRDPLTSDRGDSSAVAADVGPLRPGHAETAANRAQANFLAPRAIQQITTAAVGLADGPIELRLNPEELGHVRLRLESRDGSMAVLITAERAETLDMLRRNIDQLAAGLRDAGYKELSFGFAGQGQAGGEGSRQETIAPLGRGDDRPTQQVETEPAAPTAPVRTDSGMDIRL